MVLEMELVTTVSATVTIVSALSGMPSASPAFKLQKLEDSEDLRLSGRDKSGRKTMKELFEELSLQHSTGSSNRALKELHLTGLFEEMEFGMSWGSTQDPAHDTPDDYMTIIEALAFMIKKNNTLTTLTLEANIHPQDWKDKVFPALEENETLQVLYLIGCKGLGTEDVYQAILSLVQRSKTRLTRLYLTGTEIEELQYLVNEELRVNQAYRSQLRLEAEVPATSGRLVLCGFGFAGKTSILKTMESIEQGRPRVHRLKIGLEKSREMVLGSDAHTELIKRTRGVSVKAFKKPRYLKYIWDFAGQKEFYSLHDFLFPDTANSCFLYVCSSRNRKGEVMSQETMKSECAFWLKFIASNTKTLQAQESPGCQLPSVRFVLTKKDTLDTNELSDSKLRAEAVVRKLKLAFEGVVDLCETVEVVNAHSSRDAQHLLTLTDETLELVLKNQKEFRVCEDVRKVLARILSFENPIMSIEDFNSMQGGEFHFADVTSSVREAVRAYFHDIGEVISPEGSNFIAHPGWFGVRVLGFLINAFNGVEDQPKVRKSSQRGMQPLKLVHDHGYVDIGAMKELLNNSLQTEHLRQHISSDSLIELMIRLELCFKSEAENAEKLFLPALFDDENESAAKGERPLEWKLVQAGPLQFLGRRLECKNKAITFLTPGFFPRLQVHLRNYIHEKKWTENPGFDVGRNLICFADNGIEVIVEYSGDVDYFVDILVRSSRAHSVALEFIETHVIRRIVEFCATPPGCQGVTLVEAVIRPQCVKGLYLCAKRKDQSVLVSNLKNQLEKDEGYIHTWRCKIEYVRDTDFALDLLKGEGSHQRLFPSKSSIVAAPPGPGTTPADQCPRLFYPSIDDVGWMRGLEAKLYTRRTMAVKLHLLCDHKDDCHKVEDQPGRMIHLTCAGRGNNVNISKLALTLLWTGVCVAGGLASVPADSLPVGKWIEKLYRVPEMPDIDSKTLNQIMNHSKPNAPISKEEILKALEQYWIINPSTQGMKEILNLQDGARFTDDFRLYKVEYTEAPNAGQIGWVCVDHLREGLKQGILKSSYH